MRLLLLLFLSLFSLLSCMDVNHSVKEEQEETTDTTPKATAIFWVDKDTPFEAQKRKGPLSVRTIKAKVDIDSLGKVELLSYVKPQESRVKSYLQYRLDVFRVKKIMMDSGYVKPGVQYVQLRYVPEKLTKRR